MRAFIHLPTLDILCLEEHLEQLCTILFRNTDTLISDSNVDPDFIFSVFDHILVNTYSNLVSFFWKFNRIVN